MDFLFLATKALTSLVLPPTGFLLLALLALMLIKRWPTISRMALWLSISCLFLLSLPIVARGLVAFLDAPPLDTKPSPMMRQVVSNGAQLLLREGTPEFGAELEPFADPVELGKLRFLEVQGRPFW